MIDSILYIVASGGWWQRTIGYKIIGNEIWRFLLILLVVLVAMVVGKIVQFGFNSFADHRDNKRGVTALTLFLRCLTKPISVAFFAVALFICKAFMLFGEEAISPAMSDYWTKIVQAVAAVALAYAVFRLVDVFEHYLLRWTGKTRTRIDDMLVPVIRKSLRATIAIIATLWIADGILDAEIRAILVSAGVGGIAVALAAKDTIANFFGSVTIFADRPFQIGEMIKIADYMGPVEQVGFRSTKIRTREGHLVTVPNSVIANSMVENIGRRPFIRRISNITITYDSGHHRAQRAVEIVREVLADVPEINTDPEKPPRAYFSDFNDWSLNLYMSYWVKPPDYWLYHEVNQRVNLEIMKRFEAGNIEFAFPSQTLYVKKD
jgi:MscS family membrane protein